MNLLHDIFAFGEIFAVVISFTTYRSVSWALIHGLFSWFYVIYYLLTRKER
jgi:hypothetical protein